MSVKDRIGRVIAFGMATDETPEEIALKILAAMREPTRKMADRGYAVRPIEDCWRAMIDAALEGSNR